MTKILCLETATPVCSVALFEGSKLIVAREINEGFRHAEKLTVFIEEVLHEAGVGLTDVDAIAVSNGPGSYTGLRIGMSVAKGICYARDVRMISVSTLEIMVKRAIVEKNTGDRLFCPMIDARRMEVYCALYDTQLNILKPPAAIVIDEQFYNGVDKEVFYFGDGAEKCRDILPDKFIYVENIFPSAAFMGELTLKKFNENNFENIALSEPVYLKEFLFGK